MKRCPRCGETKSLDAFAKHRRTKDGLQPYCRPCSTAIHNEWRKAHLEHDNAYQRAYYQRDVEQRREEARAAYRRSRRDPERVAAQRRKNLDLVHRRDAGQSQADPETLAYIAVLQQDPCSYCGKTPAGTIDHIVPLGRGGEHHWTNLTAACETCNKSRQMKGFVRYMVYRLHTPRATTRRQHGQRRYNPVAVVPLLPPQPRKGQRGAAHHAAKLSQADVDSMFARAASGESLTQIARSLGLTVGRVSVIVRYQTTWRPST